MASTKQPLVTLVAVDEAVLSDLVDAAIRCADANDVTPPLSEMPDSCPERVAWLQAFHRDRRLGLDGETGAWLVRDVRGQGVGKAAVAALSELAVSLGATAITADTSPARMMAFLDEVTLGS